VTKRLEPAVHIFEFGGKCKRCGKNEEPVVEEVALFLKEYL